MIAYKHLASLAISMVFLTANHATADWFFSGNSLVDDFNSVPFPGWNPSATATYLPGDDFLGPAEGFSLFLMDFTQDLDGMDRLLDISFDVVPVDATGTVPDVAFNGAPSPVGPLPPISIWQRYGLQIATSAIDYNEFGDLLVSFEGGASFGLDNVVIDWSTILSEPPEPDPTVPEPTSTAMIVVLGIAALLNRKQRVA